MVEWYIEIPIIIVTVLITTASASAWMRKTLETKAKSDQIRNILTQVGIKNFKAKEWNDLDDNGIKALVSVITAWNQSRNPMMGGMDLSKFIPPQFRGMIGQPTKEPTTNE